MAQLATLLGLSSVEVILLEPLPADGPKQSRLLLMKHVANQSFGWGGWDEVKFTVGIAHKRSYSQIKSAFVTSFLTELDEGLDDVADDLSRNLLGCFGIGANLDDIQLF